MASLPKGSVKDFEDIYSFVYRNGRDLSGFIDGRWKFGKVCIHDYVHLTNKVEPLRLYMYTAGD